MIALALLIGGHGRRLGTVDKTQIQRDGTSLGASIIATFQPLVEETFLVGRPDQAQHPLGLPVAVDSAPDQGPLRAIATALAYARTPWVFVVATDIVGLQRDDLEALQKEIHASRTAIGWRSPHGIEPLCALYAKSLSQHCEDLLRHGERRARVLLESGHLVERPSPLVNVNTPADLSSVKAHLPKR